MGSQIQRVWDFYTDLRHLEIITPKQFKLKITNSTAGSKLEKGAKLGLEARIGVFNLRWLSTITAFGPYEYVDEMNAGLFKTWRHVHTFEDLGSGTRVVDTIEFSIPYPGLAMLLEWIAQKKLEQIFAFRRQATLDALRTI